MRKIIELSFGTRWILQRWYCNTATAAAAAPRISYEIPDEYHNSFYLANASLMQIVNYFIHASYQQAFPDLVEAMRVKLPGCTQADAVAKVRSYIRRLDQCEATVDLQIPLRRFHGDLDLVRANRAYHGITFFDTCLGGMRLDPELLRKNSQGFAAQQTYRNALFGIPMAGASGGIQINPCILDQPEIKDMLFNYVARMPKFAALKDIIEPDYGSTACEMDALQEFGRQNTSTQMMVMGKSPEAGGLDAYAQASGKCVAKCLTQFLADEEIAKRCGMPGSDLSGKTYIIQGVGKVGKEIAIAMMRANAICIGVRENDCAIYEPAGIHIMALFKHMSKYGTLRSFTPKCREHDLDSIWAQQCDILILSALQRCISCNIADCIQAKVLVEASNMPITPTAYKILTAKNKLVIPGLLAGGGPTLMSYMEYKCGLTDEEEKLDSSSVGDLFNVSLQTTIAEVINNEQRLGLRFNFLTAAYVRAIRHLFKHIVDKHAVVESPQHQQQLIDMQ